EFFGQAAPQINEGTLQRGFVLERFAVILRVIVHVEDDTQALGAGLIYRIFQTLEFIAVEGLVRFRLQPLPAKRQADDIGTLRGNVGQLRVFRVGVILEDNAGQTFCVELRTGDVDSGETRRTETGVGMGR